ncbi:PRC and DUF2382 domain-containing protein [Deinococcus multiflagellatus]|uniref:PRC and DUF2382 domain-containing protein n=1 Tax=Deinococcus multiflagellatus TaxID=1656887 RepID=UPI001CC994E3|nr:DUF2382 domain-containing protein [Deinococcus multiflagellatus]MBZ9711954.1 DUF2382 domain-containing protein [Deinococcus multiflagellatus]
MARLIPMSELVRDRNYDLGDTYNVVGQTAYGYGGEKVGTVREALTDDGGQIRYLIVDVGGWFSAKEVMVPVGMARIEDDGVYFDNLSKDQVKGMSGYVAGQDYEYEAQVADERILRGVDTSTQHAAGNFNYTQRDDTMFQTPQRLQLLEERLRVNKDRYVAGQVQIGKHVETRTENVTVPLEREEIVIERHVVSDARPVSGNVTLGAGTETVEVTLEAERANVSKQAYVTEEVEIGKRTVTEQQTVTETIGREVLDVNQNGQVAVQGTEAHLHDGRNVAERAVDAVKDAVDPLDGKIDRR